MAQTLDDPAVQVPEGYTLVKPEALPDLKKKAAKLKPPAEEHTQAPASTPSPGPEYGSLEGWMGSQNPLSQGLKKITEPAAELTESFAHHLGVGKEDLLDWWKRFKQHPLQTQYEQMTNVVKAPFEAGKRSMEEKKEAYKALTQPNASFSDRLQAAVSHLASSLPIVGPAMDEVTERAQKQGMNAPGKTYLENLGIVASPRNLGTLAAAAFQAASLKAGAEEKYNAFKDHLGSGLNKIRTKGPAGPAPVGPKPVTPPVALEDLEVRGEGGGVAPEEKPETPRSYSTGGALQPEAGVETQTKPEQGKTTLTQELEPDLLDKIIREAQVADQARANLGTILDNPGEAARLIQAVQQQGIEAFSRGDVQGIVDAALHQLLLEAGGASSDVFGSAVTEATETPAEPAPAEVAPPEAPQAAPVPASTPDLTPVVAATGRKEQEAPTPETPAPEAPAATAPPEPAPGIGKHSISDIRQMLQQVQEGMRDNPDATQEDRDKVEQWLTLPDNELQQALEKEGTTEKDITDALSDLAREKAKKKLGIKSPPTPPAAPAPTAQQVPQVSSQELEDALKTAELHDPATVRNLNRALPGIASKEQFDQILQIAKKIKQIAPDTSNVAAMIEAIEFGGQPGLEAIAKEKERVPVLGKYTADDLRKIVAGLPDAIQGSPTAVATYRTWPQLPDDELVKKIQDEGWDESVLNDVVASQGIKLDQPHAPGVIERAKKVLTALKRPDLKPKKTPKKAKAQKWEVFDPKDGKPIQTFDTEEEAKQYTADKPGLDYAQQGKGYKGGSIDVAFARVPGGKVKIGADPKALAEVLGSSLYGKDPAAVIVKELLQNSWDAIRRSKGVKEVTVDFNEWGNRVTVTDTGLGMTRKELETVFTDLGRTGKLSQADASGGFGIAKAAPFMMTKKLFVTTITEQDGKFISNTFTSTPDEIVGKGVDIVTEELPGTGYVTGTRIEAELGDDASWYYATRFANRSMHSLNAPGTLIVKGVQRSAGTPEGDLDKKPVTTFTAPGAKVTLYASTEEKTAGEWDSIDVEVNNNGIYQFDMEVRAPSGIQIPKRVAVDIKATVKERDKNYPFMANREDFRNEELKSAIRKAMQEKLFDAAVKKHNQEIADALHGLPTITVGTHEIPIFDSGKRITPEEMEQLRSDPGFIDLAYTINRLTRDAIAKLATANLGYPLEGLGSRVRKIGMVFSDKLGGVHITDPQDQKFALLFINPLARLSDNPERAASKVWHIIKHELIHDKISGHHESFTSAEVAVSEALGSKMEIAAIQELEEVYADPANPGRIRPDLSRAIQLYEISRLRPETATDVFRGEGFVTGDRAEGAGAHGEGVQPGGEPAVSGDRDQGAGSREQPVKTETPEFKRWFGDSQVVDDDGKPLVVYHGGVTAGTPDRMGITEFDPSYLGSHTGASSAEHGFFFSSSPSVAESYVTREPVSTVLAGPHTRLLDAERDMNLWDEGTSHVEAVFDEDEQKWMVKATEYDSWGQEYTYDDGYLYDDKIEAENAAHDLEQEETKKAQDLYSQRYKELDEAIKKRTEESGPIVYPVHLSIQDPLVYDFRGQGYESQPFTDLLERAKRYGNDGALFKNVRDALNGAGEVSDVWIAFDPTQIKSAIGNRGTFDPEDPSIVADVNRPKAFRVPARTPGIPKQRTRSNIVLRETLPGAKEFTERRVKNYAETNRVQAAYDAAQARMLALTNTPLGGDMPIHQLRNLRDEMEATKDILRTAKRKLKDLEDERELINRSVDPNVGEVRLDRNGNPTVYLSRTAMEVVTKVIRKDQKDIVVQGVDLTMGEARMIKNDLQKRGAENDDERQVFPPLMRLLDAAMAKSKNAGFVLVGKMGYGIQSAIDTLREELLHRWQKSRSRDGRHGSHLPLDAFQKLYHEMPRAAYDYLHNMGYTPKDALDEVKLHVIEAAAKIMADKWHTMGLTIDEAAQWLGRYYAEVTNEHGIEAVLEIEHTNGMARKFQQEVERLYGPGKQGAGNRSGAGTGTAEETAAQPGGTVSSVERGRRAGSEGDAAGATRRDRPIDYWADVERAGKTDSPRFRAWFGDSKVVDENGNPLVVYHGTRTPVDFTEFSVEGPPANEDDPYEEASYDSGSGADPTSYLGAHFAKEPSVANQFAQGAGWMKTRFQSDQPKPRVVPVYLSLQNPKDFGSEQNLRNFIYQGKPSGYAADAMIEEAMRADDLDPDDLDDPNVEEWTQKYENDPAFRRQQNRWIMESKGATGENDDLEREFAQDLASEARERLKGQGYDGVRYDNIVEGGTSYVAFEPTQIKSVFNQGGYDPDDPDFLADVEKEHKGEPFRQELYRGEKTKLPNAEYASDPGDFGRGVYYTSEEDQAKAYGKVSKRTVELRNPLRLTAEEAYDLADSYGGTVTGPHAKRLQNAEAMTRDLLAKGYDGLVVTHHHPHHPETIERLEVVDFAPYKEKIQPQNEERPPELADLQKESKKRNPTMRRAKDGEQSKHGAPYDYVYKGYGIQKVTYPTGRVAWNIFGWDGDVMDAAGTLGDARWMIDQYK